MSILKKNAILEKTNLCPKLVNNKVINKNTKQCCKATVYYLFKIVNKDS